MTHTMELGNTNGEPRLISGVGECRSRGTGTRSPNRAQHTRHAKRGQVLQGGAAPTGQYTGRLTSVSRLDGGAARTSYVAPAHVARGPTGPRDGTREVRAAGLRSSRWPRSSRTSPRRARTTGLSGARSAASAWSHDERTSRRSNRCARKRHTAASAPTNHRPHHTRRSPHRWAAPKGRQEQSSAPSSWFWQPLEHLRGDATSMSIGPASRRFPAVNYSAGFAAILSPWVRTNLAAS